MTHTTSANHAPDTEKDPWPALIALCIGFFMILLDTTIVTVATPAIIEDLDAEVNAVVWVTSAYLLAYAVPVLITGRLGDRFGPKNLYLVGLTIFTAASLWCGLTTSVEGLIVARVVQGVGASMMTPQTMAIITRVFPVARRGRAMALWGATAGVATLVGPVLGGVLVDSLGWEWIFFINVPVGLVAFGLALWLVPRLETHAHKFDWLGVVLSGLGMFALVFGIQEGHQYDWSTITGQITVWRLIGAGVVVLALFVYWQARNSNEPLMPLRVFRDRNFSISGLAIAAVSFGFTAMGFPLMLWAQVVRGYSPTESGLLLVPMAVMSIVLAPTVGKLSDRLHPRLLTAFGFGILIGAILLAALILGADTPLWEVLVAMALIGVGSSFLWAVLAATATRNLPPQLAGAGSGVYNAVRQVGAVLGSAGIAVLIDDRLASQGLSAAGGEGVPAGHLPAAVADSFSTAMSQSLLLVPAVLLLGFLAVLLFERPRHFAAPAAPATPPSTAEPAHALD
ncbi:MAG: DHA2 family efflux MFS transporter permease subunit [Nocardioidaceae bacterium]|nr:DHA2 family efflux MFS transporter permease subunit [Nocardioidaceae bacterium]